MAKLNLSQAAKCVGKSRVTLWRHINSGKLSAERDRDKNPLVDTSELIRVYGEIRQPATPRNTKAQQRETPTYDELTSLISELKKEQNEMKALLINLQNRLEHKSPQSTAKTASPTKTAEDDPNWPKTVKTMQDLIKRKELREMYGKES